MSTDEQELVRPPSEKSKQQGSERKLKRWQISDLMGEAREAIIEHDGQDYRLRVTANDKLILTK